jgi:hypothetical protein
MFRTFLMLIPIAMYTSITSVTTADDAVQRKLDAAKQQYKRETERLNTAIYDWFDNVEVAIRRSGDKKNLDELIKQRKAFEKTAVQPSSLPPTLKLRAVAVRTAMDNAYQQAIRQYTKDGEDQAAKTIEEDYKSFQGFFDTRSKWEGPNNKIVQIGPRLWKETLANGQAYRWSELKRTADYVEIYCEERKLFGRLTNTSHLAGPQLDKLSPAVPGGWKKPN